MGIRPNFSLVIGVADLQKNDSRYAKPDDTDFIYNGKIDYWKDECFSDEHYHDLNIPEFRFTTLSEIVYNPDNGDEHVCKNVTGLLLENLYEKDIFRAMCALDEKYSSAGFSVIPQTGVCEWHKEIYGITDEDIRCNRSVDTIIESQISIARMNWKRAIYYLKQCGYSFREDELHYILVWDWR